MELDQDLPEADEITNESDADEGADFFDGLSDDVEMQDVGVLDEIDEEDENKDLDEEESKDDDSEKSDDDKSDSDADDDKSKEESKEKGTDDDDKSGEDDSSKDNDSEDSQEQQLNVDQVHQELIGAIASSSGVEIKDSDEIIDRLKNPGKYVDPEIAGALAFKESGGDLATYYSLKSLDFEKMPEKEVLLQQYLKDNPKQVALNKAHAERKFNLEYKNKYSILFKTKDDFEDDDAYEEWRSKNQDDIDFLKADRENDVSLAREELKDWQAKSTTPKATETGLTDEEAADQVRRHKESAKESVSSFKGLKISFDDKPENDYNLGMSDEIKPLVQNDVENPSDFLTEIGINPETGAIDVNKLRDASIKLRSFGISGPKLKEFVLERFNSESIEGELDNPRKEKEVSGSQSNKGDILSELADEIESKRN